VGQGLSVRGHLVEVFVSPKGSWTIVLSEPDGQSCFADAGDAWGTVVSAAKSRETRRLPPLSVPGEAPAD
jgi:hypothetical protein